MSSAESAHLKITSPSGKSITIYKKHLGKCNKAECELIYFLSNHSGDMGLTIGQMTAMLKISKFPYFS